MLWLIEYYVSRATQRGFDIKFAWVYADTKNEAKAKLQKADEKFDEVITCDEQAAITKLELAPGKVVIIVH